MGSHRVERVAAQLREEISQIIIRDLKDPRIGMATITDVKLSPDLRNATVKVSVVGEDDAREAAIDGLDHAKGFIRRELGSRLSNLRFAPDLRFELDQGVAYSVRVSQLLREVQEGESNAGGGARSTSLRGRRAGAPDLAGDLRCSGRDGGHAVACRWGDAW